jgi:hypothetical protein
LGRTKNEIDYQKKYLSRMLRKGNQMKMFIQDGKYRQLKLIFSILVFFLGFAINFFSANFIHYKNLDCIQRNPDLVLDIFNKPHPNFMILTEVILAFSFILFVYSNRKHRDVFLNSFMLFGGFMILRGLFLPLTILGGLQSASLLDKFVTFNNGLFPSGHTAVALVFFFSSKNFRWYFFVASIFVMIGLLISQQHYTIDILSSVIFIYAIKSFMEKHIE